MFNDKIKLSKMVKKIIIVFGLLVVLAAGGYGYIRFKGGKIIGLEEAKAKAETFINENLLPSTMKVTIKNVTEENGLYRINLEVSGKEYDSYMTRDGKKFFQSGIDIEEVEKQNQGNETGSETAQTNQNASLTKNDKPEVELFVMSQCPYGTQIEKGILPVLSTLGSKIDFKLKFCDYAMHGQKELDEELTQYCIQKNEPNKLTNYLQCFLKAGDSAGCLTQAGINKATLESCVSATDKQFKVTEKYNDKSTWSGGQFPVFDVYKSDNEKYGVQGSPTLVINGTQASSGRDPQSLLNVICSAFSEQPEECSKTLSSATPAAGFGEGTDSSGSAAAGCAN